MTRFILPVILIGVSVAGFFVFTNPLYNDRIEKGGSGFYDVARQLQNVMKGQTNRQI